MEDQHKLIPGLGRFLAVILLQLIAHVMSIVMCVEGYLPRMQVDQTGFAIALSIYATTPLLVASNFLITRGYLVGVTGNRWLCAGYGIVLAPGVFIDDVGLHISLIGLGAAFLAWRIIESQKYQSMCAAFHTRWTAFRAARRETSRAVRTKAKGTSR